jgi:hypothetical protein
MVSRVSEATSPMIPPIMISHMLLESPRNVPVEPPVAGGAGGVMGPKNSVIGAALQSVETIHVRPQFCSSVARNE